MLHTIHLKQLLHIPRGKNIHQNPSHNTLTPLSILPPIPIKERFKLLLLQHTHHKLFRQATVQRMIYQILNHIATPIHNFKSFRPFNLPENFINNIQSIFPKGIEVSIINYENSRNEVSNWTVADVVEKGVHIACVEYVFENGGWVAVEEAAHDFIKVADHCVVDVGIAQEAEELLEEFDIREKFIHDGRDFAWEQFAADKREFVAAFFVIIVFWELSNVP